MSKAANPALEAVQEHERGNVARLAISQALAGANATIVYATGSVVGNMLAPDKALSTLPITIFVVGMAACTLPAGMIAQRHGRRAAFLFGTGCGVLVGLIAALAVLLGSFWLFCLATFFGGAYAAVVLSFRFAAADCVPPDRRARAISAVMAGGIFAGVLGPQLVTFTMDLWPPYIFAATYLAQAALAVVCTGVLIGVKLPTPKAAEANTGRPLAEIARQPRFIAAVTAGVISYMIMNLVMTSAPLAMRFCGISQGDANLGLQWHVIAMYGPSFFTGRIITRFGAPRVVIAGLVLTALSAAVGLSGITVGHFWLTLILLGIGWNFGFVGASTMVVECHGSEERNKVQSLNDFLVFGLMVVGSFASGGLLNSYGWEMVCWVALPPLLLAAVILWTTGSFRTRPAI
ncbi:MFS transporter [Roseomonas sp. SSH11]|uniref:MFS transporter n=1 Tax=Pararoseomonas baculiformis TaxID=2820812 RepID=A0ABS4AIK5_9PROT|nr:MFS transporter [Pararoseomonas baculiformis]MBP0446862.1 MFS transporter [Pararoseomonas baculiformis]